MKIIPIVVSSVEGILEGYCIVEVVFILSTLIVTCLPVGKTDEAELMFATTNHVIATINFLYENVTSWAAFEILKYLLKV